MKDLIINAYPCKYLIAVQDSSENYVIESKSIFNWVITKKDDTNNVLEKDLSWVNYLSAKDKNNYLFNTFEDAFAFLKLYIHHQEIINHQLEMHKKELHLLKQEFDVDPIYAVGDLYLDLDVCISPTDIEDILKRYSVFISGIVNKSGNPFGGVQITIRYLSELLFIEDTLKKIQKDNNYEIVNYFNFSQPSISKTAPLCYYWQVCDTYTRHFTFIKK
jgi:hypothetical protein